MAELNYKTPSQAAQEYLDNLKSLKPQVDTSTQDSDWWIKSRTIGSVASGLYADQKKMENDPFPQSARHEAIQRHLKTYLNRDFNPAQKANGIASFTGVDGSTVGIGIELTYAPNGNAYVTTESVTLDSATAGIVAIESVNEGQAQNLLADAPLMFSSPPVGINPTATASGNIADGRDVESDAEAAQAILDFIQSPPSGGNEADYKRWAAEADASVFSVNVARFIAGLGTVGLYIAAGTTDIDAAIDAGDPIIKTPSQALLDQIFDYVDELNPITDCLEVAGVIETPQNVTVKVKYKIGDGSTVPAGQTLTQEELVIREVKRALYKTAVGGRKLGDSATGYVVASDIEQNIDIMLSAEIYTEGEIPILDDREVSDLSATGSNRALLPFEVVIPGTITVEEI